MYILSGTYDHLGDESVVLGVYHSIEEMQSALNEWHAAEAQLSHYFFDVKDPNQPLDWSNDQQALYPTTASN
tara:strand:+ start:727 stop:942 length:216 start_codon:yes stop_codon:yes gene_type:complete